MESGVVDIICSGEVLVVRFRVLAELGQVCGDLDLEEQR
jgi:hypothetical protein